MVSSVDTFFQHENYHHTILILDVLKTTPDLSDSVDRPEDLPIRQLEFTAVYGFLCNPLNL